MPGWSKRRSCRPKAGRRRLVRQMQGQRELAIIQAMHERGSQTGTGEGLANSQTTMPKWLDRIKEWGQELGFASLGIAGADVSTATPRLLRWLALGRHGEMDYMAKHAALRAAPQNLLPGTLSVISAPPAVLAEGRRCSSRLLADHRLAYVSRYALGRDYHRTMRLRLQKLADRLRARGREAGFAGAVCLPRLFRFGAGPGERVRAPVRRRLARQAHPDA
jgi:hypothetical protein